MLWTYIIPTYILHYTGCFHYEYNPSSLNMSFLVIEIMNHLFRLVLTMSIRARKMIKLCVTVHIASNHVLDGFQLLSSSVWCGSVQPTQIMVNKCSGWCNSPGDNHNFHPILLKTIIILQSIRSYKTITCHTARC